MFKFIFDLVTEPLGLPVSAWKEWLILGLIQAFVHPVARKCVGRLYRGDWLPNSAAGSLVYWSIMTVITIVIWGATYGVIFLWRLIIGL